MTTPLLPHEMPVAGLAADFAAHLQAALPVIETARPRLRAPRLEDFPAYADIACGNRADTVGGPMSRTEAWDDFMRMVGCWLLRGHGVWTAELREGDKTAGFFLIGFEPGDREPELGWFLCEGREGQGLAAEAAMALRDHARDRLGLPSLVSYIYPRNVRSAQLAERLGARPDGCVDGITVWRHLPPATRERSAEP